jgi:hypothetical protein
MRVEAGLLSAYLTQHRSYKQEFFLQTVLYVVVTRDLAGFAPFSVLKTGQPVEKVLGELVRKSELFCVHFAGGKAKELEKQSVRICFCNLLQIPIPRE